MTEGSDTKVVVDVHEPMDIKMLALDHDDTTDWMETGLDAADIVVNGVGFERKTPSDFASSMTEGRLDEQVQKLTDAYDHAYILIEGGYHNFEDLSHSRLTPESARGKAASIAARHGIPVIPCGDIQAAPDATQRLLVDVAIRHGRKHTEPPSSAHLPTGAVGSDEPAGKQMWACLPGVGPSRAEDLFETFGTPVEWVRDGMEDLDQVSGIGEATAEGIENALWRADDV
jgi:DNA excision repair protein ERCC-4